MSGYTPTVEDLAWLAENQPDHFSSATQTLRSLGNAVAQGNGAAGQVIQEQTVAAHYRDFLQNGGQALDESPVPVGTEEVSPGHDPDFGSACPECESATPCITKVVVKCHDGSNTRVTLQGGNELEETGGKIYFVADHFETGEASFENYLRGTRMLDSASVDVTVAGSCYHDAHLVSWTMGSEDQRIPPATTTGNLAFVPATNPRPTLLNTDVFGDEQAAFEAVAVALDILINRAVMVKEEQFTIMPCCDNSFTFTSVTVPSLRFNGHVTLSPPTLNRRNVGRSEGRQLAREQGMGNNVRQVTEETSWSVDAGLTIVTGNNTKEINLGSYSRSTTRYDSKASLRRQRNKQSTVDRIVDALKGGSKTLAGNLSSERDSGKILQPYFVGPALTLELGTEQVEEQNKPGLKWRLMAGMSIDYSMGIYIDIYEALKRAARRHPAGAALVAFLEDAEEGRDLWVAEYEIVPSLYMDFSLNIGSQTTEDGVGNANLAATYDFMADQLDNVTGHITGALAAIVGGGIHGMFDSLFTDKTVFKYEAQVKTSGGIKVHTKDNKWGYELFHRGAVLEVVSVKKVGTGSGSGNQASTGQTRRASSVQTNTVSGWDVDRSQSNKYRLAESWTGEFTEF